MEVLKSIGVISAVVGALCVQCPANQKISLWVYWDCHLISGTDNSDHVEQYLKLQFEDF